jgi:hypothetical protein
MFEITPGVSLTPRRARKSRTTVHQALELALATPQVVAHRVTRMALAGAIPSARDRKEFDGMLAEKHVAITQSWVAMNAQALVAQQTLLAAMWRNLLAPPWVPRATPAQAAMQWREAGAGILAKGLEPMRRKAVANAKRLAKTPLF